MLRDDIRGLLRSQDGGSVIEYAILLTLLIMTIVGGVGWIGIASTRSLSPLAGQLAGQPQANSPASAAGDNPLLPSIERSSFPGQSNVGNQITFAFLGLVVFASGAIGVGWWLIARRRRRTRQSLAKPINDSPTLSEIAASKRQNLLRMLSQDPTLLFRNQLAVRHIMTTDLIMAGPAATREAVVTLMRDSQIRHMLVCDSEQRLLGIVSARDLSSRPGKTAAELMSRDVRTVSPDMLISPASTQFINMRVSSLPVVEDGRLVGILTATDLVLALQSVLQLWLHAASMMQGEVWEQEFMQSVQSHLDAADADTCCGVKGLIESLMERGQAASSPVAAS